LSASTPCPPANRGVRTLAVAAGFLLLMPLLDGAQTPLNSSGTTIRRGEAGRQKFENRNFWVSEDVRSAALEDVEGLRLRLQRLRPEDLTDSDKQLLRALIHQLKALLELAR
jgi:hypothetical protein